MFKILDLTHTLKNSFPTLPSDPSLEIFESSKISSDGFSVFEIFFGTHTGTHIDGSRHFFEDRNFLSEEPIQNFFGEGILVDVRGEKVISETFFKELDLENKILLLWSDHSKNIFNEKYFLEHPTLSPEAAKILVEKKVKMIGMDFPSPDTEPYRVHKIFLKENILLLENLNGLSELENVKNFFVMALPLKIEADSAPARVVALIENKN